ncbi:peptidase S41 [Sphingobacterium kitahiroshimense]|uniref:S41 family peptidase n=1 Tax=Sphingobacterium sp. B16(2022) TaxID=2914044 RepID=UPI00143AE176|nr:S41 family peptidase [Sphingobacterium sp. B16(2022)]NJI71992.1 peptidase S41 [Sphingobacterium sp. B16(2022)]
MNIKIFKQLIVATGILCLNFRHVSAQEVPRWIQQSAISPDGKWIAFEYQEKLWKISTLGGTAVQLTNGKTYCGYPVWSHDSKSIAYASNEFGNFDVFIMQAQGGVSTRLTYNSREDIPQDFSADNSNVLFTSARHDIITSARFPASNTFFKNLYQVPVHGGRSLLISNAGMDKAKLHKNGGLLLFQDAKGGENNARKHHTSSVTRDIWTYHLKDKFYQKLSTFTGEDLNPIWGEGTAIYYLSERTGSLNIFKSSLNDTSKMEQITHFTDHPVRNLSRSSSGLLSFTFNGDLYLLKPGKKPQKINVNMKDKSHINPFKSIAVKGEIAEMTVSSDGKQIAFVSRGELFVTSSDGSKTVKLTSTPYQERMPHFSTDGKKLLYSVERDASWDIEQFCIKGVEEQYFYDNPKLTKQALISTANDEFQGVFSPDGNQIAYVENRDILRTYDVVNKKTKLLLPEGINYSNNDGDQYFKWSPDNRSLLVHSKEGTTGYMNEVLLLKNDGSGKYTNLTKSGFVDDKPMWSTNSDMFYWISDNDSYKNFTEDSHKHVFAMYFDSKPGLNREGEMEKKRLTNFVGDIAVSVMSPDQNRLFYLGSGSDGYDLHVADLKSNYNKLFMELGMSNPQMEMTKDGKWIFILNEGSIHKINVDSSKIITLDINAEVHVDLGAERAYIFDHVYKLVKKRFMYPDLIATKIDRYYMNYKQFVEHTTNDRDFALMINEFLGELNTSHTGAWSRIHYAYADETAALGLLYDESRREDGLLVKEIISGGPFDLKDSKMRPNMIIEQINGIVLTASEDWSRALNHRTGKSTEVIFRDTISGQTYEETVKPISIFDETEYLLYDRWVRRMEFLTDSLSAGKVGYVHVRVMNNSGMKNLYDKALGKYRNAEALIVDTRFNRGGSLHDELTTFLNGKIYLTENRQNRITPSGEPFKKWTKPSIMLMSEGNYSDAYLTPYTYKMMGIGKLVGMPVPGTGTASQGEVQINKNVGVYFATAATYFVDNKHANENFQLEPDIKVLNEYKALHRGEDQQLERAIVEMLTVINK